jgi:hypothetical protein
MSSRGWSVVRNNVVRLQERLTTEGEAAIPTDMQLAAIRRQGSPTGDLDALQNAAFNWAQKRRPMEILLPTRLPETATGRVQMWFYLDGVRIVATERERQDEDEDAAAAHSQQRSSASGTADKEAEDS